MNSVDPLQALLLRHWGYHSFRPLQREAMQAVLDGRDSLVVLPTGGGKSVCFQLPSLVHSGLAVVVSPLISLMKDQVDALNSMGIEAACVNSSQSREERAATANAIRERRLKLLYIAPERLATEQTLGFLESVDVSFFAIDEAHCISQWGHDFRKEYRQLALLKTRFPQAAIHAYTATATQAVRDDIVEQLDLRDPHVLVGSFDRPNLVYRALRQDGLTDQIESVLERHRGESGIIYAISRKKVEELTETLCRRGHKAVAYHAGLSDYERHTAQNAFQQDAADIVVATVAFGMGIDKSNVRFVIHAGAPKSLEHYQQEAGRAGRDGLEAECVLFYSPGDAVIWRKLMGPLEEEPKRAALQAIKKVESYCEGNVCRHRTLVEHFDQEFDRDNCSACDLCLGELEMTPDALVISQKILSCIVRLKEGFGGNYVAQVLTGSKEAKILANSHDQLTTYGLLKDYPVPQIRLWIEQLVSQGFLVRNEEFGVLAVTPWGWLVMRNQSDPPKLRQPAISKLTKSAQRTPDWTGVHEGLFEELRRLRRQLADAAGVPPFVVFSDATLRDLARKRPTTAPGFREAHGVGEKKSKDYGKAFLKAIREFCQSHHVETNVALPDVPSAERTARSETSPTFAPTASTALEWRITAYEMFARGAPVDEVSEAVQKAISTTYKTLLEYIEREKIRSPDPWIDRATSQRVIQIASELGWQKLRPIYEALSEEVSYDDLRIIRLCHQHKMPASSSVDEDASQE